METKMAKVISVNISEQKGVIKKPVSSIFLTQTGIEGDAHAGNWHRQVSLLGVESYQHFYQLYGRYPAYGEFAENITTEGITLFHCHPFDQFQSGDLLLEVTQIGKKCHGDRCAIFKEVGNCVMPTEGIFCRVIRPGNLAEGRTLEYLPKVMKVLIITLSDRASKGEYSDKSGPTIQKRLFSHFEGENRKVEFDYRLIPDDSEMLRGILLEEGKWDFVFTTGGTGVGPRDYTPETVKPLLTREIPGIMEAIRIKHAARIPAALLSRGVAGLLGKTMLFTLPGSVSAVQDYLDEILPLLNHALLMVHGIDGH